MVIFLASKGFQASERRGGSRTLQFEPLTKVVKMNATLLISNEIRIILVAHVELCMLTRDHKASI